MLVLSLILFVCDRGLCLMQLDRLPGKLTLLTLLTVLAFASPARAQDALVALNVRTTPAGDECDKLVADGVASARAGAKAAADRSLTAATMRCPSNAAAWRELAGLRFGDSQWSDASSFARKAVGLAPEDERAWRILAVSLFMEGDTQGALRAWNRFNEPRVGTIVVSGTNHTRDQAITDRVGLEPRQLLTSAALARAMRRAEDLPVASHAVVRYFPHDADGATVEVQVAERKRFPVDWGASATLRDARSSCTRCGYLSAGQPAVVNASISSTAGSGIARAPQSV